MTGYDFMHGQFQDIGWLTEQTNVLYETKITGKGKDGNGPTKLKATQDKVIALRKWEPSLILIRKNLDRVFEDLDLFYVPKQMEPGPCIVFPQRDIYGGYARARVKPLYELKIGGEPVKYAALGMKQSEFAGPSWLGNSTRMLQRIIDTRHCMLVEGPFDLLATLLVGPDIPILTSGTKNLGPKHLDYLRILGVKHLHLMKDNEMKEGNKGGGVHSMFGMQNKIKDMDIHIMLCPSHDPSRALEDIVSARALRESVDHLNRL